MLVEIRRCPNCPLIQAHSAGLASALRTELGAEVVLSDGKPSEFSVSVDGEPLGDRQEGLASIHQMLVAVRSIFHANGQNPAQLKANSRPQPEDTPSFRLPGVYHHAGHECVAGINLLPPAWFQTQVVRVPSGASPSMGHHLLIQEPFLDVFFRESVSTTDIRPPEDEGASTPDRPDFGVDHRNGAWDLRKSIPTPIGD